MNERNTLVRSLHDVGLAVWAGGALMGAVGLNGATAKAEDPTERLRLSSLGWARWAPVNAAAIAAHGIGGIGLILANRQRVAGQSGVGANTAVKAVLTVAAAGVTAYSGVLGRKVDAESRQGGEGATEPAAGASSELATAQQHLKITQWAIPALTGVLVVLAAQQGEQQRPGQQLRDRLLNR
ncbi:MAG: hypothetical protein Q7T56_12605 [Nocardioidaceae bacterium]|nr:hypothetical protein [Nocardioidaceae bacterium]